MFVPQVNQGNSGMPSYTLSNPKMSYNENTKERTGYQNTDQSYQEAPKINTRFETGSTIVFPPEYIEADPSPQPLPESEYQPQTESQPQALPQSQYQLPSEIKSDSFPQPQPLLQSQYATRPPSRPQLQSQTQLELEPDVDIDLDFELEPMKAADMSKTIPAKVLENNSDPKLSESLSEDLEIDEDEEYSIVIKDAVEEKKPESLFTYSNQICTGIVVTKTSESSVASAVHKCIEMECTAVNIRLVTTDDEPEEPSNEKFEIIYLKTADSRRDNSGFHCVARKSQILMDINNLQLQYPSFQC